VEPRPTPRREQNFDQESRTASPDSASCHATEGIQARAVRCHSDSWNRGGGLLANSQTTDQIQVALRIVGTDVVEKSSTLAHHAKQTSAACIVLLITTHMLGEVVDPLRKDGDLHRRGASVIVRGFEFPDGLLLQFFRGRHSD
jgi:hypothetical protein